MKLRSVRYLTAEGFKNIWLHRLMTLASICVLVACMLLMGIAVLLTVNIQNSFSEIKNNNIVMVYFDEKATDDQAKEVQKQIEQIKVKGVKNVKETKFISKKEAADSFRETMGNYDEFFENDEFLPIRVDVYLDNLDLYDQTVVEIEKFDHVEHVNFSPELTEKLAGIQRIIYIAGGWIIGLLLVTALVIIANTIRITMASRRLEITIMKAVGATNNFIRFPFVVEGVAFGLISALLTTGILYLVYDATIKKISEVTFMSLIPYSSVVWYLFGGFCLIGILAGALGSMISISKYLKKEGSEQHEIL